MEAEIKDFVVKKCGSLQNLEKLPGDASTRVYYRVKTNTESLVMMSMEPFAEKAGGIPFLQIQKHLSENGVDVPKVIGFDASLGLILLEDLGDVTLLRRLQEVENREHEIKYFKNAIDALVKMHAHSGPIAKIKTNSDVIEGLKLKFDHEKLMWEVNFTIEHFYLKHLARKFKDADLKVIQDGFSKICRELEQEPTVFTHRDYHSRNLMVHGEGSNERYVMIDFQDARMGPAQYDLASLLRDSYYQLTEPQISTLTRYYIMRAKEEGMVINDLAHFDRIFDLMAVQRNFKAIGSFASFLNRRGNPAYLKYIGNTFENIRHNLMKYPEFRNLREVLYHYYYF